VAGAGLIAVIDSLELAYDDVGSGLPVVFLHAFPLNRTMWAPQVSALVERCRCLAVDLRGFGESSKTPPYSMEQYADDLAHLLEQLHVDKVVLVGCSMSGAIALSFWRRHRTRVRALVLVGARAGVDSDETLSRRRHLIHVVREQGSIAVANAQIATLVGATTREKQPDTYDAVHRMAAVSPVEGIVGALEAMMLRPDSTSTLPTIDVPTLVIAGDEDTAVPLREAQLIHQQIPGSRLETIEQSGHLSNLERPAAFNHVLTEFLVALTAS
jgi:3-oxoadipate enol-lactonase